MGENAFCIEQILVKNAQCIEQNYHKIAFCIEQMMDWIGLWDKIKNGSLWWGSHFFVIEVLCILLWGSGDYPRRGPRLLPAIKHRDQTHPKPYHRTA